MRRALLIMLLILIPVSYAYADFNAGSPEGAIAPADEKPIINFNPKEIKEKIRSEIQLVSLIGSNGKGIFFALFSLAILIEMVRMTRSTPDWAGLIVRVLVIVAVLSQFGALFTSVENIAESIAKTIMGGSAFDNLMDSQIAAANQIRQNFEKQDFGITDIVNPLFFVSIFGYISYLFGIGMHYFYYFAYNIITAGLYFIGPIIICLSIIKELDFTSGYISSVLTVCSWNVISAILIKLMSATFVIGVDSEIGFGNMFLLTIFNFSYGIAMILVPLFSLIIFSGKNFGVVGVIAGAAVFNMASKAVGMAISRLGASFGGGGGEQGGYEYVEAEPVIEEQRRYSGGFDRNNYPKFPAYRQLEARRINLLSD